MQFSILLISAATILGLAAASPAGGNIDLSRRQGLPIAPVNNDNCHYKGAPGGTCCVTVTKGTNVDCGKCNMGEKCCWTDKGDKPSSADIPDLKCSSY